MASPIRAMIADDESLARDRIRRLLRAEPGVDVVAEAGDGSEAVERIAAERPDLLFLDVQMPELDGFEVLDAARRRDESAALPVVVFVTAFDEHALRAFDVHALDYLVKPFTPQRFRTAVARARAALTGSRDTHEARLVALIEQLSPPRRDLERLRIRSDGRVFFVKTNDVDWFESAGNYVKIHVGASSYVVRESLAGLAERLDPDRFARIHRTTIVNIDRIREIQPWFSGDCVVLLRSGARLRMSRNYRGLVDGG